MALIFGYPAAILPSGSTPRMSGRAYGHFFAALHKGQSTHVRKFIMNDGMGVNHQFADGSSPLHIAAERQDIKTLKLLLQLKACPDFKNQHGQTALMLGILCPDVVQALICYNCKINTTDGQRRTALHLAGAKGMSDVVAMLLKAKAKVNAVDKWGRTSLHITLLNISHNQTVDERYKQVVDLLLSHGSDVNRRDCHYSTPLFLTVANGDHCVEIVQMLISYGAHPDFTSRHKLTPLMLATMKGYDHMCRLLLHKNCDVNTNISVTGKSCFFTAIQKGFVSIAKLLVYSGCQLQKESWMYTGSLRTVTSKALMLEFLEELREQPLSLKQLCRTILRVALGHGIHEKLHRLDYPITLKYYILLKQELKLEKPTI